MDDSKINETTIWVICITLWIPYVLFRILNFNKRRAPDLCSLSYSNTWYLLNVINRSWYSMSAEKRDSRKLVRFTPRLSEAARSLDSLRDQKHDQKCIICHGKAKQRVLYRRLADLIVDVRGVVDHIVTSRQPQTCHHVLYTLRPALLHKKRVPEPVESDHTAVWLVVMLRTWSRFQPESQNGRKGWRAHHLVWQLLTQFKARDT